MNALVIVVVAGVCLFGGTMADDPPVKVTFAGSNSSSGSKGGLLGCKPLSTSSVPGPMVRFQALRTGGVEYSRVRVPSNRMTFSDVVATDSTSRDIFECAKAASEKKWDAFSFVNGRCVGYKIGDGICPCTKGDFVLYLAKGAIRRPSSAKPSTAAKGRAAAAPPPAGYIRKIIYPTVSMIGDGFESDEMICEDFISEINEPRRLLHNADGRCYITDAFASNPCNDSCAGTATEVLLGQYNFTEIHLLSMCGGTVTPEFTSRQNPKSMLIFSHEGYGCIPYPDPASDDNCSITVLAPAGAIRVDVSLDSIYLDIDASAGDTCEGDGLYVYKGPPDASPCIKKFEGLNGIYTHGNEATIRFQRKPAHNKNSVNKGFLLHVTAHDHFHQLG